MTELRPEAEPGAQRGLSARLRPAGGEVAPTAKNFPRSRFNFPVSARTPPPLPRASLRVQQGAMRARAGAINRERKALRSVSSHKQGAEFG
ncbi:hypothetical protein AOLI_G00055330 [Acnodon oligacanthus]